MSSSVYLKDKYLIFLPEFIASEDREEFVNYLKAQLFIRIMIKLQPLIIQAPDATFNVFVGVLPTSFEASKKVADGSSEEMKDDLETLGDNKSIVYTLGVLEATFYLYERLSLLHIFRLGVDYGFYFGFSKEQLYEGTVASLSAVATSLDCGTVSSPAYHIFDVEFIKLRESLREVYSVFSKRKEEASLDDPKNVRRRSEGFFQPVIQEHRMGISRTSISKRGDDVGRPDAPSTDISSQDSVGSGRISEPVATPTRRDSGNSSPQSE